MDWQQWMTRWDHQQEGYLSHREQRFDVILDVVARVTGSGSPRVLDLATGPGSLASRVIDRFPDARVVAVDDDPVLQLLGRSVYGDRDGRLRWVLGDLTDDRWADDVRADGPYDAVVSTTALHWLDPSALVRCFVTAGALLRAGGVLVDGDHTSEADSPRLRALQESMRAMPRDGRQEYRPWWDDLQAAAVGEPELAEAFAERARRNAGFPQQQESPTIDFFLAALRVAGFTEVGTVWQEGDDRVLVALK